MEKWIFFPRLFVICFNTLRKIVIKPATTSHSMYFSSCPITIIHRLKIKILGVYWLVVLKPLYSAIRRLQFYIQTHTHINPDLTSPTITIPISSDHRITKKNVLLSAAQVLVEKFGLAARFGFTHLAATNIAVWARLVIWDSAQEWTYHVHVAQRGPIGAPAQSPLSLRGFPGSLTKHIRDATGKSACGLNSKVCVLVCVCVCQWNSLYIFTIILIVINPLPRERPENAIGRPCGVYEKPYAWVGVGIIIIVLVEG